MSSDGEAAGGAAKPENPWGYYYLRYFVGAVVGAGLLALVLRSAEKNGALPFSVFRYAPKELPGNAEQYFAYAALITALGAAGLAFCYVASAPILVLHAFRGRVRDAEWVWRAMSVATGVTALVLALFVAFLGGASPGCLRNLGYIPFSLVLLAQIFALFWPGLGKVREYYCALTAVRAERDKKSAIKEYVESYQHLREHGNAFLILLMEVILAAALYAADTPIRFFGLVVVWIVPAAFTWFVGTWLEFGVTAGAHIAKGTDPEDPNAHH